MKPWFEKEIQEADIIKFPEPERKVIKMPSVSEYPDFISGVQDLQARLKQGQIGQDSYDKLYQDLIQRFMKKESFENPWFLREQKDRGLNRGDAMEFLLAAAVHHRLISVNYITPNSFLNFITKTLPRSNPVKHSHSDRMDKFNLAVGVKQDTFKYIFNPKVYSTEWKGLIPNAVKFANEQLLKQLQFLLNYERRDAVEINSFGMAGAKVDVEATVSHKDATGKVIKEPLEDLNMSLKIDSGKLGQASGFNKDQLYKLFNFLGFGEDFLQVWTKSDIDKFLDPNGKYKKLLGQGKREQNIKANKMALPKLKEILEPMGKIMSQKFASEKTDERSEYKLLGNLIKNEIQGGEDLSLVQFSSKGYSVLSNTDVKKLVSYVKNKIELEAKYAVRDKNPYIEFIDKQSGEEFLHIRTSFNTSKGYLRSFIEQGPGMDKFKQSFK